MGKNNAAIGPLQIGIILLAVATAVMHIGLGLGSGGMFLVVFLLNGLGYLGLLGALYLPLPALAPYRAYARFALIGYTLLTILLYFVANWPDVWGVMGLTNKVIELILVVLLLMERNQT